MGEITLSKEIEENLQGLIKEKDWPRVNEVAEDIHPYDLWEFIEKLDEAVQQEALSNMGRGILVDLLPELPDERQIEFIEILPPKRAAELLMRMPSDEGVDVLKNLSTSAKRNILRYFTKEKQEEARRLIRHPSDTAGGIMTTEVVYLDAENTVKDAIDYIREKARDFETIYYVYVVDKDKRLVGVSIPKTMTSRFRK